MLDENGMPTSERKISPKEWNTIFLKDNKFDINDKENATIPIEQTFIKPSLFKQFSVFVKRDVLSKLNNTQYLLINLEAPVLAFILAFMTRYQMANQPYTFIIIKI